MNTHRFLFKLSLRLLLACICSIAAAQQQTAFPPGTDAAKPGLAAAAATGPRTSPFNPMDANDHVFVTDKAPKLDTACLLSSSGPIIYNIEITRHVGELNPDGTLKNAAALVAAGLLSPTATLSMPAFDVDSEAVVPPPFNPERDRVSFNGQEIGFLSGINNQWKLNSFEIPIEKVRFAARGAAGEQPAPALNEVRIDIDTANTDELWCTSIDWGAQSFKAMSPIILIHGNNSDGDFFKRRGFTEFLESQNLLYDNSINLPTTTIAANASTLNDLIPGIVKSFGVDSAHLVVHSKGGLDSREYLANFQPGHDEDFKFLSYSSLSTPHNGSVGADLLVQRSDALKVTSHIEFAGFPAFTQAVAEGTTLDDGTPNLTTTFVAGFNEINLPRLPKNTVFNTVAADADTNGNTEIDRDPDEYAELRAESTALTNLDQEEVFGLPIGPMMTRQAVNTSYQLLRTSSGVTLTFRQEQSNGVAKEVAVLTSVPNAQPLGNDVLVTIPSGHGISAFFAGHVTNTATFRGNDGRNHSSIANARVAEKVVPWLIAIEKTHGDLK